MGLLQWARNVRDRSAPPKPRLVSRERGAPSSSWSALQMRPPSSRLPAHLASLLLTPCVLVVGGRLVMAVKEGGHAAGMARGAASTVARVLGGGVRRLAGLSRRREERANREKEKDDRSEEDGEARREASSAASKKRKGSARDVPVATLPKAVSDSAKSIAALRALEMERHGTDALFEDRFAAALAGEEAMEPAVRREDAKTPLEPYQIVPCEGGVPYVPARVRARVGDRGRIAVRTKFFDDAVAATVCEPSPSGQPWQVVLLGAGLDTRAWRLHPASPSTPLPRAVFELDVPEVLDHKRAVMSAACVSAADKKPPPLTLAATHRSVAANFVQPDWASKLRDAGHDPLAPTVWVLEGLLYYLAPETVSDILRRTAEMSAAGSALVASVVNEASVARARRGPKGGAKATWQSWVGSPEEEFGRFAWEAEVVVQPGEKGADYGRWEGERPPPRRVETAEQREIKRRENENKNGRSTAGVRSWDEGGTDGDLPRTFYVICRVRLDDAGTRILNPKPPGTETAALINPVSDPGTRACVVFPSVGSPRRSAGRLLFHRPALRHDASVLALYHDPEVMTHLPGLYNISESALRALRERHREDLSPVHPGEAPASCMTDIVLAATGAFVGVCGFHRVDASTGEAHWCAVIARGFRRQGFATEALASCVAYARSTLAWTSRVTAVVARVPAQNAPAIAFLEATAADRPNGRHGLQTGQFKWVEDDATAPGFGAGGPAGGAGGGRPFESEDDGSEEKWMTYRLDLKG